MSTTTTANKTASQALLALTQQASGVITIGSPITVNTGFGGRIFVKMGRTVATALTNQVGFRFEVSAETSANNDEWYPLYTWSSTLGTTTAQSTTLNGATTAGNTTAVLTSGTSWAGGQYAYFRETGTPANSEWSRVASLSTNTITLEEAQTRNHTNSIAVTNQAESFTYDFDGAGIVRVRLVVDSQTNNSGAVAASGQTVDVLAWLTTFDSTTTA